MRKTMKAAKKWETPELIILLRGKPEEAVLRTCKISGGSGGADTNNTDCGRNFIMICTDDCHDQAAS
jgi:hypothetical protein